MSLFYRMSRWSLKQYFRLFHNLTVIGIEKPCHGRAILAPNHASYLDPPLVSVAWPEEVHFLARASLFNNGFLNWLFTKLNAHPVEANGHDIDSLRLICKLLEQDKKVVIFPEG